MAQFQGGIYIRPQVVSVTDDSRLVGPNDANGINIAIVGSSTGGQPNTPLVFTSARDAHLSLRGGELLNAIERAYAPGSNVAGAYRVTAVRINQAVAGTLTLNDGSAAPAISLVAADYGAHTNQLSVSVTNGTLSGAKITIQKAASAGVGPILVIQDNVGRSAIQVRYGTDFGTPPTAIPGASGTAAVLNVTYTGGATPTAVLSTTITGLTGDNLTLDLTVLTTLQQVVDAINAQGHYAAAVVGPDPLAPSTTLDGVAGVNILSSPVVLRSDFQAMIDFFNSLSGIVTATNVGTTNKTVGITSQKYFAGGSDGPVPAPADWANALAQLQNQDIQIVVPVTADATIHAMVNSHCQSMSSPSNKRERVCIVGGAAGETVTQAKTRALNLNSDRAQLVYPGMLEYATDNSGKKVTVAPYLIAAQKAGLTSALPVANSATNKPIGSTGVEIVLKPSEIDDLVSTGVTVIENAGNRGFRIVQDLLTWQADQRYTRREFSTKLALDVTARTFREALLGRIGSVNGPALQSLVNNDIARAADRLTQQGVLVGGAGSPAYSNLQVEVVGDQVRVAIQVSIAVPANFFFISIFPTVFSSPAGLTV